MPGYLVAARALNGQLGYFRWTVLPGKGPSDAINEVREWLQNNQGDTDPVVDSSYIPGHNSPELPIANPTQPLNMADFILKQNGGNRKQ